MALISDALAPLRNSAATPPVADGADATVMARAREILAKEKLLDAARPPTGAAGIADRLGKAMALGTRATQVLPEIGQVHDALVRNDDGLLRERLQAVYRKVGWVPPSGAAFDRLAADVRAAFGAEPQVSQRLTIERPDYTIDVRDLQSAGKIKIDVIMKDGGDGQPARASYSADVTTRPDASGKDLERSAKPAPVETLKENEAAKLHESINGRWIDQDGQAWEIGGSGNAIELTAIYASGHRVLFTGTWRLGAILASHTIDDPRDIKGDVPETVKAQLAAKWHPAFGVDLAWDRAKGSLAGSWSSQSVTYSMDNAVQSVQDPWDKPMTLSRGSKHTAQGGRWPAEGP